MSRKSRFGGPFNKQHGKQAQTLLKSASHHLHHIDWSTPSELSWKKYLLLTYQILGLLVNTLAPDEKYPLLNRDNFTIPIQMELSQNQKNFSHFFPAFLKSRLNFKHLKIKYHPHRFYIFEVSDSENVDRWMFKKSRFFRGCFDKQHGKRTQTLLKSASQHLYHIHWSLWKTLCSKNALLLTCEIVGLLLNTFATDEKYPAVNRDNLTIPFQMELSQKRKSFSEFFAAFLKSIWSFEHFEKKDDPHSFCISEITDSEKVVK